MSAEDFVKLSVRYRADFSLAGVSDAAELTFLRGMAHVGLNGLKGVLPAADVRGLLPRRAKEADVVAELVGAGFWQPGPTFYIYRSWSKWQDQLDMVEEKRAKDAKRKREERSAAKAKMLGLVEDAS